jgi:hypothetical protein
VPDFIVLQTTSPDGIQKVWTELGRPTTDDAATAFQSVKAPLVTAEYLVLDLTESFTASIQTTITTRDKKSEKADAKAEAATAKLG